MLDMNPTDREAIGSLYIYKAMELVRKNHRSRLNVKEEDERDKTGEIVDVLSSKILKSMLKHEKITLPELESYLKEQFVKVMNQIREELLH